MQGISAEILCGETEVGFLADHTYARYVRRRIRRLCRGNATLDPGSWWVQRLIFEILQDIEPQRDRSKWKPPSFTRNAIRPISSVIHVPRVFRCKSWIPNVVNMEAFQGLTNIPKLYVQSGIVIIGISLYLTGLIVYRLFLSPIAKIPGSKLSAATGWYETYYDVYKGGKFIFQIEKWHQQYG